MVNNGTELAMNKQIFGTELLWFISVPFCFLFPQLYTPHISKGRVGCVALSPQMISSDSASIEIVGPAPRIYLHFCNTTHLWCLTKGSLKYICTSVHNDILVSISLILAFFFFSTRCSFCTLYN